MQQLQPKTTLQGGKYRLDGVLGQGGFGNTYVGYNTEFEETVAIKEFFMKGVTERDKNTSAVSVSNAENVGQFEEQREKFKKEARRLRRLKNEHIVKVHDLFEENGTAYYVMDYIDGESLAQRMKRTGCALTEHEVRIILPQILDALQEVHKQEIWHLDIKPGNIIINKDMQVYLIDFGASKQIRANGNMTTSTALCYTPGYAPNEQIGQMYDRFGPWTDIYALGATIYNLLTNKKPPMPIDIEEDEEEAFDLPNSISENMRKLVVRMMQPMRKARPQCVEEIMKMGVTTEYDKAKIHKEYNNEDTQVLTKKLHDSKDNVHSDSNVIINSNIIKVVDLGLSVLWANCNIISSPNSTVKNLFRWGDTTGQQTSMNVADYIPLHKYNTNQITGDFGGTDYDIATISLGKNWRTPNRNHWLELIQKCTWRRYYYDGVRGYFIIGPSGKHIILPVTGIRYGDNVNDPYSGHYWTSELAMGFTNLAYYFYFDMKSISKNFNNTICHRFFGNAIRPVYKIEGG